MAVFDLAVMIPFFFVLALVYGSLDVSKVFGNRGVKAVIAVAIAFFSVSSPTVIGFIYFVMPYAALFFIAFFFLGFVMSVLGGEKKKDPTIPIIILALLLIFLSAQDSINIISFQDQNFVGMVVLLVIALILFAAYKKGE